MTSISAAEMNRILYRYLQESGFAHTAYNFQFEAGINNLPIDGNSVPPASLIKLVQTGLQFKEMEANAAVKDADDEDFCFLPVMDLITKDISELQKIVKGKKGNPSTAEPKDLDEKGNEGTSSRVKVEAKKVLDKQQGVRIEEGKNRVVGRRSERVRRKY